MGSYNDNKPTAPKGARVAFGILMVCVYIGVGLMFIFSIFSSIIDNTTLSYVIGGLLCLYGVWRGYRLYRGWN